MSTRHRKNHFYYANYTRQASGEPCQFCNFTPETDDMIEHTESMWLTRNIFPYDVWDTSSVQDHLMIVPKRHVDSVAHFNPQEQKEFLGLLGKYESKGYSVYARAPSNKMKSVVHQHTHLIKLGAKKRTLFYIEKPRLLISK